MTVYAQKRQPDVPDRAGLGGGLRVAHIPAGAAGKRGDAELRARWRRERPDVVHAVSWTTGLPALMATRDLGIPVVPAFSSPGVAERRDHASADPAHAAASQAPAGAGHGPARTVVAGAVTKTARLPASKGPQSTYVRNS